MGNCEVRSFRDNVTPSQQEGGVGREVGVATASITAVGNQDRVAWSTEVKRW